MNEAPQTNSPREKPRDTLNLVRGTVRSLLLASPAFCELEPDRKTELASAMVKVCHTAAELIREEIETVATVKQGSPRARAQALNTPGVDRPSRPPTFAQAQNAGS